MSDASKPSTIAGHSADDRARTVATKVSEGLQAAGVEPSHRDAQAKSAGYGLNPDPTGRRDPIGRPDAGRSDGGADLNDLSRTARAAAGEAADRAAELAGQARDRAAALADETRDRLEGAAEGARKWVSDTHRANMRRIDDAVVRGSDGLNRGRSTVEQFVTENPMLVGVVGVAAGLLLGALLPRTRQEDRNIGPYADEVRDQGLRYAREFTNRGRDFVEAALDPDNIQAAAQKAGVSPDTAYRGGDRTGHGL